MTSGYELHQLSESQKSIWYLEKAYPGTSINIVAGTLRLKGDVNYGALEKALNLFVKKSDALRLRIHETDGAAMQYVTDYEEFKVDFFDFSAGDGLKDLFAWDEGNTRTPFNMDNQQLFYCAIFKVSDDEGGFYMKMHHLISDAWTMGLLTRQVVDLYSQIKKGLPVDDNPNPSYIEHLISEAEYEKSLRFENDKAYWNQKFNTLPEMTVLKPQKNGGGSIRAKRKTLITPLKLSNKIREFCRTYRVSPFTLFMSALAIYINRVTGLNDVILGTTILNRTCSREKETAGMFVSVAAPVRIAVDDNANFIIFSKAMIKETTDVLRHQKYPYNYLIRDLKKIHKFSSRLFDIVLSYQNSKFRKDESEENYVGKWLFSGCQVESLIISINDREDGGNLIIDYDFLTDVFDIKEIEFIHQHVISLLWHALDNPLRRISKLEMISEREKQMILQDFNHTHVEYQRDMTICKMFEAQAEKSGNRTALVLDNESMTYQELNEKANRFAQTLRDKGVGPGRIVGIMATRSFELIVGIIGILKAGGAYMPIDPGYPAARRDYMLRDSCAVLLVTQNSLLDSLKTDLELLSLDDDASYSGDGKNLPAVSSSHDLAYVIYTSGSTGMPKGVMIEHTGVINSFCWGVREFSLDEDSVILQKTAPTFDPSVWEIFWWIMLGGKICLIDSGAEKDPEAIIRAVELFGVTAMHFVPSMMSVFLDYVEATAAAPRLKSLRQVLSCGEAISVNQVKHFNRLLREPNGTKLYNMYGPTEATVEVSCFECTPDLELNTVPLGKRIDNFSIYILDRNMNLLPVGVPGEIYISGVGLGRGYLGNQVLTAERFIPNPFSPGQKMYKTGDKARWYPKGDIEFLGRIDYQVKIKGYRIELGEIEARLLSHPSVLEAVVKDYQDDNSNMFLSAFVVAAEGTRTEQLRSFLQDKLPEYMIPSCFVILPEMPKTPNGKVDRNALPRPEYAGNVCTEFVRPADETEAELADIWQKVLGVDRIGVLDEYTSVGGDSLKAIMILTGINKKWGIEVSPKDIFRAKNIRELARLIKKSTGTHTMSIPKVTESAWYPVSAAQKRQYILQEMEGGFRYNLPGVLVMEGKIDAVRIGGVFRDIIARHESLRTSFDLRDGEPVQRIHQDVGFAMSYTEADDADVDKLMAEFICPFSLDKAPLMRVKLVKTGEMRYILLFDMHHIISDGASINILFNEFVNLYEKRFLPELGIQYKDYASWHNEILKSEKLKKQEAYWLNKFSGDIPLLNMPTDFSRPAFQSNKGKKLRFAADETLTRGLKLLAKQSGTTLYAVLLSSYIVLLSKYSGQEDIVVGTVVEGRPHDELRNLIGMFVNTLALRFRPSGNLTFGAFLAGVAEEFYNAYDNNEYPFEVLVEKAGVRRDISRNPLFDTMFILQNMVMATLQTSDFVAHPYVFDNATSKFDFSLEAFDRGKTIEFTLEYCTDLFREETVRKLSSHYINALSDIVRNPLKKLSEVDILSEAERRQLLFDFNDTAADYPIHKTIHQIFEEQSLMTPDKVAVIFNGLTLTYAELNKRANAIAHMLRSKGVGPDKIVGIMSYRSVEMMVGILGILKAGGAYMPIDPDYPSERRNYMLRNSATAVLLAQSKLMSTVEFGGEIIDLNDSTSFSADTSNPQRINKPKDLAYVIYTSGSTGQPKGVMIEHSSVVNRIHWMQKKYPIDESSVIMQKTTYSFDVSVWELFWWSFVGASVCLINPGDEKDPEAIIQAIEKFGVTTIHFVPSMLTAFLHYIDSRKSISRISTLRQVFASGEALTLSQVSLFNSLLFETNGTVLSNLYGPTEATVDVSYFDCSPMAPLNSVPIGKPIDNISLYILDKDQNLLPVGIPGELYIGGTGVARGYLNAPHLTSEKFTDNPYTHNDTLYRTGDRARWHHNGNIEFLGRMDFQVKIRGFRIEIGEIESILLSHPDIMEAAVCSFNDDRVGAYLVAYIVAKNSVSADVVRDFLAGVLPEYMIPSSFIFIDKMPLNYSGKTDRKALAELGDRQLASAFLAAPSDETEAALCRIWEKYLRLKKVGVSHSYSSLGGDSLNAIMIVLEINKTWGIDVSVKDIFSAKNVRELAKLIKSFAVTRAVPIPKVDANAWYPASAAQKRVFAECNNNNSTVFNMPNGILIKGIMDKDRLKEVFRIILQRHESLRTSFGLHDGLPVQIVHEHVEFNIEENDTDETDLDKLMTSFIRPFDLSKAPLIRVKIARLSDRKNFLMLNMHHIISDGTSLNIILKEMVGLLSGSTLPDVKIQYKDYTSWHNEFMKSELMRKQEAFWLSRLSGEIPVINLPTDFPRPTYRSLKGCTLHFSVNEVLTEKLKRLISETETTLYMVMMSAYSVLLSKYTEQEDIIVGITVEGRNHPDLRDIVGMFVNTPVVRSYPSADKTFKMFLNQVKEELLNVYDNQDYPFEELVAKLKLKPDTNRSPLYDTLFMMHNVDVTKFRTDDFTFEQYRYNNRHSKVDLGLSIFAGGDTIPYFIEYSTDLFKKETIERLAKHYENILWEIVRDPSQPLRDINLEAGDDLSREKLTDIIQETA